MIQSTKRFHKRVLNEYLVFYTCFCRLKLLFAVYELDKSIVLLVKSTVFFSVFEKTHRFTISTDVYLSTFFFLSLKLLILNLCLIEFALKPWVVYFLFKFQVRDLVEKCTCPSQFPMVRVSEGKYRIGDTKVLIFVRVSSFLVIFFHLLN